MSRGVLMYAHNNTEIDYVKIACANALMIKKNLGVPTTLVTDSGSLRWSKSVLGQDTIDECFENIITENIQTGFKNSRNYSDTSFSTKSLQFYNANHWQAYDLSPYDETLFIDADYLIMSNQLNKCWGSMHDVMINHEIYTPGDSSEPYSKYIDDMSIKLQWATVIYFKKSELAEHMFTIAKHVQDNYEYYKDLYHFSNGMFRNDHAFSIAVHSLNGFGENTKVIYQLPIPGLLMSWDVDDVYAINDINDITLYVEKKKEKGTYTLARIKNIDVHIMNKWAINRHADKLIELYRAIR
jgi:hypothetical protein